MGECIERASDLIRGEGDALCLAPPGPERAVEAVSFAGSCQHGLEDRLLPLRRRDIRYAFIEAARLVRRAPPFLLRLVASRLINCRVTHLGNFCQRIRG